MILLRLCHALAFLTYVTSIIGSEFRFATREDYRRWKLGLPPRQALPISNDAIKALPAYKRVRVATIHYDYTENDPFQVPQVKAELAAVRQIFQSMYNFEGVDITIPITNSQHAQASLEDSIRSLYSGLSEPETLVIIYYGGHGGHGGTWTLQRDDRAIRVDWRAIDSNIIAPTGVDTLQIIDACHAEGFIEDDTLRGVTAPAEWLGRGALSVISAASAELAAGDWSHAFTKAFIYTLTEHTPVKGTYHFTPRSLYNALPVPGPGYAYITEDDDVIEASLHDWAGPQFFEFGVPVGSTERFKIAPLPCRSN